MSHAASSAYREGGRRISSALSRIPTRQQTPRRPITPQRRLQQASRRRDRAALGAAMVVIGVLGAAGVLRFWEQPIAPPRSTAPRVSVAAGRAPGAATTLDPKIDPRNSHIIVPPQHVFQTRLSVEATFPGDTVLGKLEPATALDESAAARAPTQ